MKASYLIFLTFVVNLLCSILFLTCSVIAVLLFSKLKVTLSTTLIVKKKLNYLLQ